MRHLKLFIHESLIHENVVYLHDTHIVYIFKKRDSFTRHFVYLRFRMIFIHESSFQNMRHLYFISKLHKRI